ncbi:hypothetical protein BST79_gp010 [Only Syngen Nebraska virus 5]|uniref:hypothetical protein n=1 Tax=Only Syngen Nebraska virus 5 TaxID=1917232 RepID=UPI0009013D43|nr:hypothetical protein BST79_gp010 [Only Syngen Nebraska virus 5]APC25523.1 hypothetical protein [Only Syngen Nebraska virus 5]
MYQRALIHTGPTRPVVLKARCVKVKSVSPEIMHIITEYVCPVAKNCADMYIGDETHQMGVLNKIGVIMDHYNITHGEGYVLRALFQDNIDLAVQLAKSFNTYNLGIEIVRETIQKLPDVTNNPSI